MLTPVQFPNTVPISNEGALHHRSSVHVPSKSTALSSIEDPAVLELWNAHVLPQIPDIVRTAEVDGQYTVSLVRQAGIEAIRTVIQFRSSKILSTFSRQAIRHMMKKVCDQHMLEALPIQFTQGGLIPLVRDSTNTDATSFGKEVDEDIRFPHERRYYSKLGMGASIGLSGCPHISASLGGFVNVGGREYMLANDHLFDACPRGCKTFNVQSPSISDAEDVRAKCYRRLRDLELTTLQNAPNEIPLGRVAELLPKELDKKMEQYMRIMRESGDNPENLQKYDVGVVRERSGKYSYRESINPHSSGKQHKMDWSLIEVTAIHRRGKNIHRYGQSEDPSTSDLFTEAIMPEGVGEACTAAGNVVGGERVHYVGTASGFRQGRVSPGVLQYRDEHGKISYEWSMVVPNAEQFRAEDFQGDSGAWILSDDNKLLGQLWGWANGNLLFTPIVDIFADIADKMHISSDSVTLPQYSNLQTAQEDPLLCRRCTDSLPAAFEDTDVYDLSLPPVEVPSSRLSPPPVPSSPDHMSLPSHKLDYSVGQPQFSHAGSSLDYGPSIRRHKDDTQSSTSGKSSSTRPTTMNDPRISKPLHLQPAITEHPLEEQPDDGRLTVSDDSEIFITSDESNLIIQTFTKAVVNNIPKNCLLPQRRPLERPEFLHNVEESVRNYCIKVMNENPKPSRIRQASKAIRRLRNEISFNVQATLGDRNEFEQEQKPLPSIVHQISDRAAREQTAEEKCSDWDAGNTMDYTMDGDLPQHAFENWQDPFTGDDISVSMFALEDQGIYAYLVGHSAFSTLKQDLHMSVERHFGDQTRLIRHRLLQTFRRPRIHGLFQASLRTDWDPVKFLEDQYPMGRLQPIRHVLTLIGNSENAQLTTVEQYLHQNWPSYTYELVDHITYVISKSTEGKLSPNIEYSPEQGTVSVFGPEDLVIAVAQQLAWLGAVCRASTGQLAFCYTALSEIDNPGTGYPVFNITYDVSISGIKGSSSCWHDLVGDSVIAYGFPIPERPHGEIGLQLPMELMAILARIPFVTCFRGGHILKGRSMMLVPVERRGTSVQWHLFQKRGDARIGYEDLADLCPNRLLLESYDEADFLSAECFLGWWPQCDVNLATEGYNYRCIQYSKTLPLSKRTISLTSFSVGFQQWGAAGLNYTLGKKQGYYRNEMADFYHDLLDDAAQIHVVLQDMEERRAWHTNAETMILHIILHRHDRGLFRANNATINLHKANANDSSSVRNAMLSNADTIIGIDKHLKEANVTKKLFSNLVVELYTIFEALKVTQADLEKEIGFEVTFDRGNHVYGWEYCSIVDRELHPQPRRTKLENTCGKWPKLMRELQAVVLLGNCFQDVFRPTNYANICCGLRTLPQGKDLLAMQAATLQQLYHRSGSSRCDDDMARITPSGTKLHPSRHLFEACPNILDNIGGCRCERIQQLDFSKSNTKVNRIRGLGDEGAIIIGKGDPGKFQSKLFNRWNSTPTPTSRPLTYPQPQPQQQPLSLPVLQSPSIQHPQTSLLTP